MNEQALWEAYTVAAKRWMDKSTDANARAAIDSFAEFAAVYLPDPVQAHEAVEDLRRNMQRARPLAA